MCSSKAYDIIGDIHGYADVLKNLLHKLGYRMRKGAWRHPERMAIFVGDLIDRGPRQLETVDIVRRMIDEDAARAVMGNHEFNAIAYGTMDENGIPLRKHSEKNRHQHQAFLDAVADQPQQYHELLDWFASLPLWLELEDINVIHACWHTADMEQFGPRLLPGFRLSRALLPEAAREPPDGTKRTLFHAVEAWLKGLEISLPAGIRYYDVDGIERDKSRICWWNANATRLSDLVMLMDTDVRKRLQDFEVPPQARCPYSSGKPLFFGHYWMQGPPLTQNTRMACVDYSIARQGKLVAYRWNGESRLSNDNFVIQDK
jgi:hypothetical protein